MGGMNRINVAVAFIYVEAMVGWMLGAAEEDTAAFLFWSIHFLRRAAEALFVARYQRKGVSGLERDEWRWGTFLGALAFYFGFGAFVGYFAPVGPTQWWQVPGMVIFAVGETGNAFHHWLLSRHQRDGLHGEVQGGLFWLVERPHYTFELISWAGYALAFPTVASWAFFFASFGGMASQVLDRTRHRHRAPFLMVPHVL